MKNAHRQFGNNSREVGSALLIAIFALLLISVVGIALLISTGTDSALAGNYRTSTSAYYASVAGLEEARGRLLWKNPAYVNRTNAYGTLFSPQGTPSFAVNDVLYILNPNPITGETVDPLNAASPYADQEYGTEFTWGLSGANVHPSVASVSALPAIPLPGPSYKWVRINPVTEYAVNLNINSAGHGHSSYDQYTPLYYDGTGLNLTNSGNETLEVTAFSYMPDRSTRILQYIVAPSSLSLNFPAALTLAGNGVSYLGPDSSAYYINGNDPTSGRSCTTPPMSSLSAIGYTNSADQSNVVGGTSSFPANYVGFAPPLPAPPTPSVGLVSLPASLQKPSQIESLIQNITLGADVVIQSSATGDDLPSGMSPTNPMTVVINGDLNLSAHTSWSTFTGYGLLLVTGTLSYDPDVSWEGIVLVMGKGTLLGAHGGIGRIDGAVLVAQSRNPSTGSVLPDPTLGPASVSFASNMGSYGIYYNSCTILQAQMPSSYRLLSFREITPP
jgi:hypothetical protein